MSDLKPLLLPAAATVATGLFAGSSLYISAVQTPAALKVGAPFFSRYWPPMFKRAAKQQASLAAIAAASALSYAATADSANNDTRNLWIAAGATIGSVIPYTFVCMMPTNNTLLGMARDAEAAGLPTGAIDEACTGKSGSLLQKWCRLHDVRTGLSVAAFVLAALALAKVK